MFNVYNVIYIYTHTYIYINIFTIFNKIITIIKINLLEYTFIVIFELFYIVFFVCDGVADVFELVWVLVRVGERDILVVRGKYCQCSYYWHK